MSLVLRYAGMRAASTVDGPGVRTVIWFQGCSIHCGRCQNKELWDKWGGQAGDPVRLAQQMVEWNKDLGGGSHRYTVTGGEPFDQAEELLMLVTALRALDQSAHIVVYTGHKWERLVNRTTTGWRYRRLILFNIKVLVDGPYMWELDNDHMQYIGSGNQRVIDVESTLDKAGALLAPLPASDLVLLDWATSGMITIADGAITAAKGWMEDACLNLAGKQVPTLRCGESERGTNGNGGDS